MPSPKPLTRHERFRSALEALARPLPWERRAGFRDSVASGGLTRYSERWLGEALECCPDRELAGRLERLVPLFAEYSASEPAAREQAMDAIDAGLRALNETLEGKAASWREVAEERDRALDAREVEDDLRAAQDIAVQYLKGVGPKIGELLARLGIETAYDLLHAYPRTHQDRRHPTPVAELQDEVSDGILVRIGSPPKQQRMKRVVLVTAQAYDDTGSVELAWFNQPWLVDKLPRGTRLYVVGRPEDWGRRMRMTVSEYEVIGDDLAPLQVGRIVPVYPLTEGLQQQRLRSIMSTAVERFTHGEFDPVPLAIREKRRLLSLPRALRGIHFPADPEEYEQSRARLAYGELLALQVEVARRRREIRSGETIPIRPESSPLEELEGALPFRFTNAQRKAAKRILTDLRSTTPMSRLLHGDVGSGKTAVVMAALLACARAGLQAAMMVPTEILAQQHFRNLKRTLGALGVEVTLLVGSLPKRVRDERRERVRLGDVSVVVGTHALIQEGVDFRRLALVCVDEQHRFGVAQRSGLAEKGLNPHSLVLTATPIPRTLALTVYGHLSVSVLDEMPPGRQEILTKMAGRKAAYQLVRKEAAKGRQAYIICPLIEKSEALDCEAAEDLASRLRNEDLEGLRVGLLHGRMPVEDRDATMAAFAAGELDAIVSTTVVEVGVDIPNATVMVIENAERFGLAQLHQLRGRVGRGEAKSYCLLLCGRRTQEARERLEVLCRTTDGFEIAMEDLRIRGPGEFFGARQSGLPDLRIANVLEDIALLEMAREDAEALVEEDPELLRPEVADLAEELHRRVGMKVGRKLMG